MLRSAAKNAASVTVISDPADYDAVLAEMHETGGCTTLSTRRRLQVKVYQTTAAYDTAISRWLAAQASDVADTSAKLEISLEKVDDLRYGENPQQKATVYRFAEGCENTASSQFPLVGSEQIQGKPLSYNNYLDADAAWNLVREFDEPACVILKHQNPCGSAVAEDITAAYDRAFACDPKSAFGGIIACNREVPYELVEHFADQNKQFVEVIIAPSYTAERSSAWPSAPTCACWPPAAWTTAPGGAALRRRRHAGAGGRPRDRGSCDLYVPHRPQAHRRRDGRARVCLEGLQGRQVQRHPGLQG